MNVFVQHCIILEQEIGNCISEQTWKDIAGSQDLSTVKCYGCRLYFRLRKHYNYDTVVSYCLWRLWCEYVNDTHSASVFRLCWSRWWSTKGEPKAWQLCRGILVVFFTTVWKFWLKLYEHYIPFWSLGGHNIVIQCGATCCVTAPIQCSAQENLP